MAKKPNGYHRILLKLSGEALGGPDGTGIDSATIKRAASEMSAVVSDGRKLAVVMGAGNFFRGITGVAEGMDRVVADQMGMVATVINAMALKESLEEEGVKALVLSAVGGAGVEVYTPQKGRKMLEKGKVVLCAGGTGNPFFTTDTAAVLRALELECEIMLKATMVDGVYDKDPKKSRDAKRFETITYGEVLARKLKVMDLTAVALAEANGLPIGVFNFRDAGMLARVAKGDLKHATLIVPA
jgi:uridylate kinase